MRIATYYWPAWLWTAPFPSIPHHHGKKKKRNTKIGTYTTFSSHSSIPFYLCTVLYCLNTSRAISWSGGMLVNDETPALSFTTISECVLHSPVRYYWLLPAVLWLCTTDNTPRKGRDRRAGRKASNRDDERNRERGEGERSNYEWSWKGEKEKWRKTRVAFVRVSLSVVFIAPNVVCISVYIYIYVHTTAPLVSCLARFVQPFGAESQPSACWTR